jgi:hypothetical protein
MQFLVAYMAHHGPSRLFPCGHPFAHALVGVHWELYPFLAWRANHCLGLLCVHGKANMLESLDEDV